MARPTKYSEPLVKALCQIIEGGTTIKLACDSVGIDVSTYNAWTHDKPEFSEAIKRARAKGAENLLADIKQAGRSGTWQASAWILERSYSEHYGRQQATAPTEDTSMKQFLDGMNQIINGGIKSDEQPEQ